MVYIILGLFGALYNTDFSVVYINWELFSGLYITGTVLTFTFTSTFLSEELTLKAL
ncbi:hypothetical protein [Methanosarcina sp.]|uniref:hypothetical protein n=1 Tax=Methanosarcina sp. TaxID=2213 RepID=UPI00298C154A|nr:hypothetical protein [Methanosarcina sp.]